MESNHDERPTGFIERGVITAAESAGYTVKSMDRNGIISPPLQAAAGTYSVNDRVLFVLFPDGTGKILAGI